MHKSARVLIAIILVTLGGAADNIDTSKFPGEILWAKRSREVTLSKAGPNAFHAVQLSHLALLDGTLRGSPLRRYVVSGRVVSHNTGGPWEHIPIYTVLATGAVALKALTNADGEFRFSLSVGLPSKESALIGDIAELSAAELLVGDASLRSDDNLSIEFNLVRRYKLKDLLVLPN